MAGIHEGQLRAASGEVAREGGDVRIARSEAAGRRGPVIVRRRCQVVHGEPADQGVAENKAAVVGFELNAQGPDSGGPNHDCVAHDRDTGSPLRARKTGEYVEVDGCRGDRAESAGDERHSRVADPGVAAGEIHLVRAVIAVVRDAEGPAERDDRHGGPRPEQDRNRVEAKSALGGGVAQEVVGAGTVAHRPPCAAVVDPEGDLPGTEAANGCHVVGVVGRGVVRQERVVGHEEGGIGARSVPDVPDKRSPGVPQRYRVARAGLAYGRILHGSVRGADHQLVAADCHGGTELGSALALVGLVRVPAFAGLGVEVHRIYARSANGEVPALLIN